MGTVFKDGPSLMVIGRLIATSLSFITAPIIARAIGPEGRGETASALAVFYLVPIVLAFGVPMEIRRLSAADNGGAPVVVARLFALSSTLVAVPVALICSETVFQSFSDQANFVATLGVATSPLTILWMNDTSVFIALGKFRAIAILQIVQPVIYLAGTLYFYARGSLSVETVLAAYLTGNFAVAVLGWVMVARVPRVRGPRLVRLLHSSTKYSGSAIAEAASNRLDQVLMIPVLGVYQSGLYAVAVTVASIPAVLGQALGAVHFRAVAQAPVGARSRVLEVGIRDGIALGLISVPLVGLGAVLGVPLLFGTGFREAVPATVVLSVGTGLTIAAYVTSMMLGASGRGWLMTFAQLTALAVGMLALFALGPSFGAVGAAVASVVSALSLMLTLLLRGNMAKYVTLPKLSDVRSAIRRLLD
ncbi:lipopolysaccharide biosynthesis protein [Timonella senegalensis]|uniref:lipopolysaccharide biosynthesis protein n=2 Tax=Timonella senegalensis TaxID=1465825 RepID=UPI002FE13A50